MKSSRPKNTDLSKHYILTRPTRLSEMTLDDLEVEDNSAWREKAMRLQNRRWRKIKNQLA